MYARNISSIIMIFQAEAVTLTVAQTFSLAKEQENEKIAIQNEVYKYCRDPPSLVFYKDQ